MSASDAPAPASTAASTDAAAALPAAAADPAIDPTPSATASTIKPSPTAQAKLSSGPSPANRCRTPTTEAALRVHHGVLAPSARHDALAAWPDCRSAGSVSAAGDGDP